MQQNPQQKKRILSRRATILRCCVEKTCPTSRISLSTDARCFRCNFQHARGSTFKIVDFFALRHFILDKTSIYDLFEKFFSEAQQRHSESSSNDDDDNKDKQRDKKNKPFNVNGSTSPTATKNIVIFCNIVSSVMHSAAIASFLPHFQFAMQYFKLRLDSELNERKVQCW